MRAIVHDRYGPPDVLRLEDVARPVPKDDDQLESGAVTREDFTKNGKMYDAVFDAVGKQSFRRCRRSLNPRGVYIATDGFHNMVWALWTRLIGDKKVTFGISRYTKADVLFVKELIEAGEYRAVIDRSYPLEDVIEATRYVETEQKTGNVVLVVAT
jgi:NADPH2:quinone reductase